jgi:hypothetical protein
MKKSYEEELKAMAVEVRNMTQNVPCDYDYISLKYM